MNQIEGIIEFKRILSDLIRFKSIAINHEECVKTANYLSDILRDTGFKVNIVKIKNGNPVIFAEIKGDDESSLLFYNHYDVQPAEPIEEWLTYPFELKIRNGYLYGRGVGDNKGNIVSRLIATKNMLEKRGFLPYGVKFVIEGEEEAGSPHLWEALKQQKEKGFFRDVKGAIWEFGGYNRDGSVTIYLGLKGILYIEMKTKRLARDAHSALAVLLPSATWDLIDFLVWLRNSGLFQLKSFYDDLIDFDAILRKVEEKGLEIAFDEDGLKREYGIEEFKDKLTGREALRTYYGKPTFNIDGIYSGFTGKGQKTVLPKEAAAKIDFRLVPYQDPKKIGLELCRMAKEYGIECKIISSTPPAYTDLENSFVRKIVYFLKEHKYQIKIAPWSPASGPMYYFTRELNIPTISGIGVSYWGSAHHAPNENIRVTDVEKTISLIEKMLLDSTIVESK